jgi:hypothetical protein
MTTQKIGHSLKKLMVKSNLKIVRTHNNNLEQIATICVHTRTIRNSITPSPLNILSHTLSLLHNNNHTTTCNTHTTHTHITYTTHTQHTHNAHTTHTQHTQHTQHTHNTRTTHTQHTHNTTHTQTNKQTLSPLLTHQDGNTESWLNFYSKNS